MFYFVPARASLLDDLLSFYLTFFIHFFSAITFASVAFQEDVWARSCWSVPSLYGLGAHDVRLFQTRYYPAQHKGWPRGSSGLSAGEPGRSTPRTRHKPSCHNAAVLLASSRKRVRHQYEGRVVFRAPKEVTSLCYLSDTLLGSLL